MKKMLSLSYKGGRDYLHGSDIFNELSKIAAELEGSHKGFVERLTFRRFARMACEVFDETPVEQSRIVAHSRFRLGSGSDMEAWVVETEIPVTTGRPFDEEGLVANALLDVVERRVSMSQRSIYTPIEEVIALTKCLNYAVCPDVKGKWVFGQLDLSEPLQENYQTLEIQMKNLIPGRFSVNKIILNGRDIGTMRFIVGAP